VRLLPAALLFTACSTVHGVKPVGKGALAVEASLGGPFVELYGAPVPLPLTTLGATYGVTDLVDVHAAVHPTATAAFNLIGLDAGVSGQLMAPEGARPRLMADLSFVFAAGDNEPDAPEGGVRLFAQPGLAASWDWGKSDQHTAYASVGAFVEPRPGPHALGWVGGGNLWGVGRTQLVTELKWLSPWADTEPLTPHWYAPANQGAIALQLGARYTFGGPR